MPSYSYEREFVRINTSIRINNLGPHADLHEFYHGDRKEEKEGWELLYVSEFFLEIIEH